MTVAAQCLPSEGVRGKWVRNGHEDENIILIVMKASYAAGYIEMYQIAHFKYVQLTVFQLWLHKVV